MPAIWRADATRQIESQTLAEGESAFVLSPQGKDATPVLTELTSHHHSLAAAAPKQTEQVFTELFVLESTLGFKPVLG